MLTRKADSFAAQAFHHAGRIASFLNSSRRLVNINKSMIGLPKMISTGEKLQSGSGIFLICIKPLMSLSRLPDGVTFDLNRIFTDFTATSARPLGCPKYADDFLCRMPHLARNRLVSLAENSGPPSDDSSFGTPNVANYFCRQFMRPLAPD